MKTVAKILELAAPLQAGFHIRVENEPWMILVIEDTQERGPNGLPAISVAHCGEQNGDLMRDPEMAFEAEESSEEMNLVPFIGGMTMLASSSIPPLRRTEEHS